MRLDKYLSLQGYTRKQAKALAAEGRVSVGGQTVRDASVHVDEGATVCLDGAPLAKEVHQYLMLSKPQGVITATEDRGGRPTVLDLIPKNRRRRELGPVGRLDKDVTGLILLTTDGQLAHRLISPRFEVHKRYWARVEGPLTEEHVRQLASGIQLSDFVARPARLRILESGEESLAELIVTEGKYHQVKRMFGALGRPVTALRRLSIGPLTLPGDLDEGDFRALNDSEIESLYRLVSLERP